MRAKRVLLVLLAVGAFLGALLLAYLQVDPLEIDSHELERAPARPERIADAAAVLVVDDEAVQRAAALGRWSTFDFSWAWLGDLEERFGRTTWTGTDAAEGLDGASIAVISASAAGLDAAESANWLAWAEPGRRLVIEMPGEPLAAALGFEFDAPVQGARLDSIATRYRVWPRDEISRVPVHARRLPPLTVPREARALLWMDGAPAAWSLPHGRGEVILVGIEFSRWMNALRQGVPQEDFSVLRTRGSGGREQFYQPNDFMADPDRPFAWVPRADLLLRNLLEASSGRLPLPRWSPIPPGARGVMLYTIDEENFGDRATFQAEESARHGAGSTYFVVPGRITVQGTSRMLEDGADVQLHWNRGFWERQIRTFGVGPLRPVMREMNLLEQRDALASRLPEGAPPVNLNRNHGLMWDDEWSRTFRILHAAEFVFDSTYGPDEDLFGWVFDTARPFRPLDRNGYPFPLVELPFPYQDDENYAVEWQRRLLRDSAEEVHGVLAPIFHSVTMKWNPAAFRMRGWLELYDDSARRDHPVWSVSRYLRFQGARRASALRLVAFEDERWEAMARVEGDTLRVEWPAREGWHVSVDGRADAQQDLQRGNWRGLRLAPGEYRIEGRREESSR